MALPFNIDRNLTTPLSEQVADGLRMCIRSGRYAPGDVIPSLKDLRSELGVSQRVAREAIRRLVADGLAVVRPRSGCRVLARSEKSKQGRILAVLLDHHRVAYLPSLFVSEAERLLLSSGYEFETVYVRVKPNGMGDFSSLEAKLRAPFDLVFSLYATRRLERCLVRCGVPYVPVFSSRRIIGAATSVSHDKTAATGQLVRRCVDLGVRTAWVADYSRSKSCMLAARLLEEAGIDVEHQRIPIAFGHGALERLERAGHDAVLRRFAKGRERPDLALFYDDYYFRGAFVAFSELGVRIPEDVRVATIMNSGFVPVAPVSLAGLRVDARKAARVLADVVPRILAGKKVPDIVQPITEFVDGASLGRPPNCAIFTL